MDEKEANTNEIVAYFFMIDLSTKEIFYLFIYILFELCLYSLIISPNISFP